MGVLTDSYFNILITLICHHLNLNTLYYIKVAKIPFPSHSWISRSNLFKGKWSERLSESHKIWGQQRWRGRETGVGLWFMELLHCCRNRSSGVRCSVFVFKQWQSVRPSVLNSCQGTVHGTAGSCDDKTVPQSRHTRFFVSFYLSNLPDDTLPVSILSLTLIFFTSGPAKVSNSLPCMQN